MKAFAIALLGIPVPCAKPKTLATTFNGQVQEPVRAVGHILQQAMHVARQAILSILEQVVTLRALAQHFIQMAQLFFAIITVQEVELQATSALVVIAVM